MPLAGRSIVGLGRFVTLAVVGVAVAPPVTDVLVDDETKLAWPRNFSCAATREDPRLFVAHHYTRSLGDLSGGQAIGRILARTYELEQPQGVEFYDFVAIPKPKPYKDAYRARLDALPLDEAGRHVVLAEVKDVFALNGALFAELTEVLVTGR